MGNGRNYRDQRYGQKGSQPDDSFRDRTETGYEEERGRRNQSWSPTEKPEYRSSRNFSDESRYASGEGYGYGRSGSDENYGGRRGGYGGGEYGYGESGSERGGGDRGGSRYGYGAQGGRSSGPYPESDADLGYGRRGQRSEGESRGGYGGTSFQSHESGAGGHRGKGPKGYSRSDERIREDINERLFEDDHLDASDIEVEVSGGEVTLSGQVIDRRSKRRAEDLAEDCSGVKDVQNNIRVKRDGETQEPTDATTRSASAR